MMNISVKEALLIVGLLFCYNRPMKILIILSLFSFSTFAKGRIFSLGAGLWSPSISLSGFNDQDLIQNVENSKFARLSHEGLMGKNFLYVVGIGLNVAEADVQYSFEGDNSTTNLENLKADISMVEVKLGVKYNLNQYFYLGAGGLVGDFQITYDRDDYLSVLGTSNAENFIKSENQNYLGHYAEAGFMIASQNLGFRGGVEYNSASIQSGLETLGTKQPTLNSSKLYIEVLWKN
jgi:hypothetical protein